MIHQVWDVDDWVNDMLSVLPDKNFYPTAVAKDTGLPLQVVFERLIYLTQDGKLDLQWEIYCPKCLKKVEVIEANSLLIDKVIYCKTCNKEFKITPEIVPDIVFPLFKISRDYRERVYLKENV